MKRVLVLFDLDETLFDHLHASRSGLMALQADYAGFRRVGIDELETAAYDILNRTHTKVLAGLLTQDEGRIERFRLLAAWCGADLPEDEMPVAARRYREVYRSSRRAMTGAIALLEQLRGRATIGIVTNNFVREQRSKLVDCKLDQLIDFMVTSDETGHPKPAREIFDHALAAGHTLPPEAVMVGDSWAADILGARGAGIRPVWYNPAGTPQPEGGPVRELRSFLPTRAAIETILSPD
jgi:HAD superfamily hydrolase (TIGR01549 family)